MKGKTMRAKSLFHRCTEGVRTIPVLVSFAVSLLVMGAASGVEPLALDSRIEPFFDDFLVDSVSGTALRLHTPLPRDIAIVFDAPWEGNTSAYWTVFQDSDLARMYYRASNYNLETKEYGAETVCYAKSRDGIRWTKPELGIVEFNGSKANNIVWKGVGTHNFSPFKDANPNCPPDARYKALASGEDKGKLLAFKSSDAIHWSLIQDAPVITEGAFDSQNIGFWDATRNRYVDFHRGFRDGVRDIMTSTSNDFLSWTKPEWLDYGTTPPEHLYTNSIVPYPRAPHIFVGFPKRFVPERDLHNHAHDGISDGVFMTSRDGLHWNRWREAFIRPGLQKSRWVNRNNMTAWGFLQTKSDIPGNPDEYSLYSSEGYYVGPCQLRRFTVRLDGFVSMNAPGAGGEFTTKVLSFADDPGTKGAAETELIINYSTSAAGAIRCAILDEAGVPIPGYTTDECDEIFGDDIERAVTWRSNSDVKPLAGRPIRLRFTMRDADLYSIHFR